MGDCDQRGWIRQADCQHYDPDWWIINGRWTAENTIALRICDACPVRVPCHADAVTHPELVSGVIQGGKVWHTDRRIMRVCGCGRPYLTEGRRPRARCKRSCPGVPDGSLGTITDPPGGPP